jgi:hypothetical protein
MANDEPASGQARLRRWVKVYDPESNLVSEGVLLDDGELERQSSWLHDRLCISMLEPSDDAEEKAEQQAARQGYCDQCRDFAANLLAECPYLDMSRPDQMVFTDEGMNWQRRPAEIPDHKVPVAIDERRRRFHMTRRVPLLGRGLVFPVTPPGGH